MQSQPKRLLCNREWPGSGNNFMSNKNVASEKEMKTGATQGRRGPHSPWPSRRLAKHCLADLSKEHPHFHQQKPCWIQPNHVKTALPSEPVKAFTSLMGSNDKSSAMQILAIPVSKISEPIALGSQSQAETGTTPRSCTSSSFAAKASAKAALDAHVGALVQADLVTCEASPLASILSTNSIHFKPSCSGHL